jgi:hypothetical protein
MTAISGNATMYATVRGSPRATRPTEEESAGEALAQPMDGPVDVDVGEHRTRGVSDCGSSLAKRLVEIRAGHEDALEVRKCEERVSPKGGVVRRNRGRRRGAARVAPVVHEKAGPGEGAPGVGDRHGGKNRNRAGVVRIETGACPSRGGHDMCLAEGNHVSGGPSHALGARAGASASLANEDAHRDRIVLADVERPIRDDEELDLRRGGLLLECAGELCDDLPRIGLHDVRQACHVVRPSGRCNSGRPIGDRDRGVRERLVRSIRMSSSLLTPPT